MASLSIKLRLAQLLERKDLDPCLDLSNLPVRNIIIEAGRVLNAEPELFSQQALLDALIGF